MMNKKEVKLPLNLSVYPFFVMGDRFVQGVITKKLLHGLIEDSDYTVKREKISLEKLKKRIEKKYKMSDKDIDIDYNKSIKLFEVKKKGSDKINSYISSDGRYILVL